MGVLDTGLDDNPFSSTVYSGTLLYSRCYAIHPSNPFCVASGFRRRFPFKPLRSAVAPRLSPSSYQKTPRLLQQGVFCIYSTFQEQPPLCAGFGVHKNFHAHRLQRAILIFIEYGFVQPLAHFFGRDDSVPLTLGHLFKNLRNLQRTIL